MFLMMAEVLNSPRWRRRFPESEFWEFLGRHQPHVEWVGCSLHDLIQPSFSFLVGVALPFSIASRRRSGQSLLVHDAHAFWRAFVLVLLGIFLRSMGKDADELHVRGHADADRPGLRVPVPARPSARARPVDRAGGRSWSATGRRSRSIRCPGPTSTTRAWACRGGLARTTLSGFAAHWNKNSNLAWAFDTWFLNLFPRESPFVAQRRRLRDPELHPDARHDDPRPARRATCCESDRQPWCEARLADRRRASSACSWARRSGELGVCPVVKRIWTPSWVLFSGGWCFLILAAFYAVVDVARPLVAGPSRSS